MYLPLHVGAEGKTDPDGSSLDLGYVKDNTGENISALNPFFCELTGLYWAWKNVESDYIGLAHYRRHFSIRGRRFEKEPFARIAVYSDIAPFLGSVKIFVPNKRRYYIETLYSHYAHTFSGEQLDITRQIIGEKCPEYLNSYDKVLRQRHGYMFNMFIMEKTLLDRYCEWLFDILFELFKRVDASAMNSFQRRFCGRVSEIIFNVWLEYQMRNGTLRREEIKELPYVHMEKVDWVKKGGAFLKAKFLKKKYEKSF